MSRLTEKYIYDEGDYRYAKSNKEQPNNDILCLNKLRQLEDVLQLYNIDNANDLDIEIRANRDKVYKYEGIEKELGIDLSTLFKAGKELAYYDNELGLVQGYFSQKFCLDIWSVGDINHKAYIQIKDKILYIKDYGKTWALTKEELEQ